jgi:hypothetical protein
LVKSGEEGRTVLGRTRTSEERETGRYSKPIIAK